MTGFVSKSREWQSRVRLPNCFLYECVSVCGCDIFHFFLMQVRNLCLGQCSLDAQIAVVVMLLSSSILQHPIELSCGCDVQSIVQHLLIYCTSCNPPQSYVYENFAMCSQDFFLLCLGHMRASNRVEHYFLFLIRLGALRNFGCQKNFWKYCILMVLSLSDQKIPPFCNSHV